MCACIHALLDYVPFEICEFPIARHTHPCVAIHWNLVGKVRGQRLAQDHGLVPGLDIGLVGPVARGASRFENLLAPQKTYWPGGPVDLKTYWPPKKLTGPPKN